MCIQLYENIDQKHKAIILVMKIEKQNNSISRLKHRTPRKIGTSNELDLS